MEENANIIAWSIVLIEIPSIFWGFWSLRNSERSEASFSFDKQSAKFGGGGPSKSFLERKKQRDYDMVKKRRIAIQQKKAKEKAEAAKANAAKVEQEKAKAKSEREKYENYIKSDNYQKHKHKLPQEIREKIEQEKIKREKPGAALERLTTDNGPYVDQFSEWARVDTLGKILGFLVGLWTLILCAMLIVTIKRHKNSPDKVHQWFKGLGYAHASIMVLAMGWTLVKHSKLFWYSTPYFVTQCAVAVLLIGQKLHKCPKK